MGKLRRANSLESSAVLFTCFILAGGLPFQKTKQIQSFHFGEGFRGGYQPDNLEYNHPTTVTYKNVNSDTSLKVDNEDERKTDKDEFKIYSTTIYSDFQTKRNGEEMNLPNEPVVNEEDLHGIYQSKKGGLNTSLHFGTSKEHQNTFLESTNKNDFNEMDENLHSVGYQWKAKTEFTNNVFSTLHTSDEQLKNIYTTESIPQIQDIKPTYNPASNEQIVVNVPDWNVSQRNDNAGINTKYEMIPPNANTESVQNEYSEKRHEEEQLSHFGDSSKIEQTIYGHHNTFGIDKLFETTPKDMQSFSFYQTTSQQRQEKEPFLHIEQTQNSQQNQNIQRTDDNLGLNIMSEHNSKDISEGHVQRNSDTTEQQVLQQQHQSFSDSSANERFSNSQKENNFGINKLVENATTNILIDTVQEQQINSEQHRSQDSHHGQHYHQIQEQNQSQEQYIYSQTHRSTLNEHRIQEHTTHKQNVQEQQIKQEEFHSQEQHQIHEQHHIQGNYHVQQHNQHIASGESAQNEQSRNDQSSSNNSHKESESRLNAMSQIPTEQVQNENVQQISGTENGNFGYQHIPLDQITQKKENTNIQKEDETSFSEHWNYKQKEDHSHVSTQSFDSSTMKNVGQEKIIQDSFKVPIEQFLITSQDSYSVQTEPSNANQQFEDSIHVQQTSNTDTGKNRDTISFSSFSEVGNHEQEQQERQTFGQEQIKHDGERSGYIFKVHIGQGKNLESSTQSIRISESGHKIDEINEQISTKDNVDGLEVKTQKITPLSSLFSIRKISNSGRKQG